MLLDAVIANPDSDHVRLVYADWLDENGRPERAEFIRTQIRLATLDSDHEEYDRLKSRCETLITSKWSEWRGCEKGEFYTWDWSYDFTRGFVESISPGNPWSIEQITEIMSIHPATSLHAWGYLAELPEWPHLARIREFIFGDGESCTVENVRAILQSPFLTGIRSFNFINCGLEEEDLFYLGANPKFAKLNELKNVRGEYPSRVLLQFLSLPNVQQLTHFDFPSTDFTSDDLNSLVTWRAIPILRSISFNPIGFLSAHVNRVEGIRNFFHRAPFERLEQFELSTGIDDDLIDLLLRSPFAGQLTRLELGGDRITARGIARLFHGGEFHNLRDLSLRDFEMGAGWVEVFRGANLPNLKSLSVIQSDVDDRAVVALSKSDLTRTLRKLTFHFNRISDDGAIRFATNPAFKRLRDLSLSANRIDRVGARALSRSRIGARMTWENLWGNPVTSRGGVFAPENNSQRPLSDWPFVF